MGAVTYPDERISSLVAEYYVPVQINIVDRPEFTDMFVARWTPTIMVLDTDKREHRRIVGYTSALDFAAYLLIGRAQLAFDSKQYEQALHYFERIVSDYPDSDFAPEALYMVGVANYRATDDGSYLDKYWDQVMELYPDSRWARAGDV